MALPSYFFHTSFGLDMNSQIIFNISKKLYYKLANLKKAKVYISNHVFRVCFIRYIAFKIFQTKLVFNNCRSNPQTK